MIFAHDRPLADFIALTKDGEWGKSEPFDDSVRMRIIRGTDFAAVREGDWSGLPIRHVSRNHAELKSLADNDILIETAGGSRDRPTGRTLFVKPGTIAAQDLPVTCASFARFIRLDPDAVEPAFVYWWLQHLYETKQLLAFHTQHTGVARFQWTTCSHSILVPLLGRSVQRTIATILTTYDDLIENNNRRIKLLEEMARRIYGEWFVDFRYPGHENVAVLNSELGPLPEGWSVNKLGVRFAVVLGGTPSRKVTRYWENGTIAWINSGRVNDLRVLEPSELITAEALESSNAKVMPRGATLVAITGATLGQVSLLEISASANQSVVGIYDPQDRLTEFLYLAIRQSINRIIGAASGGAQQHINQQIVHDTLLGVPLPAVSDRFRVIVRPIFHEIAGLLRVQLNLKATRDLLLPRLVSGRMDVSDLDIATSQAVA